VGKLSPRSTAYELYDSKKVDLTPWKHAKVFSVFILLLMIGVYAFFSPIGVAEASAEYSPMSLIFMLGTLVLIGSVFWFWRNTNRKQRKQEEQSE
ncbi:hypothetical protein R0K17_22040, partial [Planococcus sp. SIMBA_143]